MCAHLCSPAKELLLSLFAAVEHVWRNNLTPPFSVISSAHYLPHGVFSKQALQDAARGSGISKTSSDCLEAIVGLLKQGAPAEPDRVRGLGDQKGVKGIADSPALSRCQGSREAWKLATSQSSTESSSRLIPDLRQQTHAAPARVR